MSDVRILIVEDEWLVAQGIKESLEDLGYEVVGMADTGEEALHLAARERPPCQNLLVSSLDEDDSQRTGGILLT